MTMLSPSESVLGSAAVFAVVLGVFEAALPHIADVRVASENDADLASAERLASWTSAAVVTTVAVLAKDPTIFMVGGIGVIALAWWHRHANAVNPSTGKAVNTQAQDLSLLDSSPDLDAYSGNAA